MKFLFSILTVCLLALAVSAQEKIVNAYGTIPQLLQLNPNTPNNVVVVQGLATLTDGYGGVFAYSASSAVSTNTTNAFAPTTLVGRWTRQSPQAMQLQSGIATSAADGTVTNTFVTVFPIAPIVVATPKSATALTNVVSSITTSNCIFTVGAGSVAINWIAITSP